MLIRIVRMTFQEEQVESFLTMFDGVKDKIRAFEGCEYLELWRDLDKPNVLMTYSHWENREALEGYRHSELFKSTWAKTKAKFADRPVAFSVKSQVKIR